MWKLGAGFLGLCSPEISNNKPQLRKKEIEVLDLGYMVGCSVGQQKQLNSLC